MSSVVSLRLPSKSKNEPVAPRLIFKAPKLSGTESLAGRRILFPLPPAGAMAHEVIFPVARWRDAGATVLLATLDGSPGYPDFLGKVHASFGMLHSPRFSWRAFSLMRRSQREEWYRQPASLQGLMAPAGALGVADEFDAIVVPGGQGRALYEFLRSSEMHDLLQAFAARQKIVALQCHSVIAGAWTNGENGQPLWKNREAICWPALYDRVLGVIPGFGGYFQPLGHPIQNVVDSVGAKVHYRGPFRRFPHVVIDGNLWSSLGPYSAHVLAEVLLDELCVR